jgi:predicted lipase
MNITAVMEKANLIGPAIARLKVLIEQGAVKADIDAQKAVIEKVIGQFKEVAGIGPKA